MIRRITVLLAGLLALVGFSTASVAAPLSKNAQSAINVGETLVQKTHGCHRNWRRGHRHVGPYCRRVGERGYRDRGYRDRRYRGRRCRNVRSCKYVGPIKVCKNRLVCRGERRNYY